MIRFIFVLISCLVVVNALPLSCIEDAHCSDGYYCDLRINMCQKCLQCQDLKREPPKPDDSNTCIKSANTCGSCTDGFINIYRNNIRGKCVSPEFFIIVGSRSHYVYVWTTAAVVGVVVVAVFIYVIRHTDVFRIIAYYNPVPERAASDVTTVSSMISPRHILKNLLHIENKNTSIK